MFTVPVQEDLRYDGCSNWAHVAATVPVQEDLRYDEVVRIDSSAQEDLRYEKLDELDKTRESRSGSRGLEIRDTERT